MLMKQLPGFALAMLLALNTSLAADATLLGNRLTPLGGEVAGNAAGTIPPWQIGRAHV